MRFKWCMLACLLMGMAVVGWSGDVGDVQESSAEPGSEAVETTPPQPVMPEPDSLPVSQTSPQNASEESRLSSATKPKTMIEIAEQEPWDFSPYRVLIWLVSDDPTINATSMEKPLRAFLDRDYFAAWRFQLADAPAAVGTVAVRDLGGLSYDLITSADPVLAVKRNHPEAVRIRTAKNVGEWVQKVYVTKDRADEVKRRAADLGDPTIDGIASRLDASAGGPFAIGARWTDESTEAVLVSRGMAMTLTEPEAKLITPRISGLVGDAIETHDKVFIVHVRSDVMPNQIEAVEFDTLMRHFGPVASVQAATRSSLPTAIGRAVTKAFAPIVRIDNAGQKSAVGLLRAGGLIVDENSPAAIRKDDVLEPMTRKNDRNGNPILIGAMDWAYLLVTEIEGRNINMDFYAGRVGGLQGRKNKRTFRTALKVRPFGESTLLRLHLQREPDFPMIGFELYEKELKSTKMTFVGRTDWNGRLQIGRSEDPFRLLYVKNGGSVLARLPLVPGLNPKAVADLSGDDMRLQAEAYIRGVQNAIIDLVAIRKLFEARIHLRLERGEMEKAETLMNALREQPSNEQLATDMGKKQTVFLTALGTRNANQRRKVDEMFTTTRELLSSQINPKLLRDLEADMIAAKKNGGKLPRKKEQSEDEEPEVPPAATAEAAKPSE